MAVNRTRNRTINFRCTDEEYDLIMKKISASGRTNTEFLIDTLKKKKIVIYTDLTDVLTELKREGINLNQCLRVANYDENIFPELNEAIKNCNELYLKYLEIWKENKH